MSKVPLPVKYPRAAPCSLLHAALSMQRRFGPCPVSRPRTTSVAPRTAERRSHPSSKWRGLESNGAKRMWST